jgi:hypothetical protein
MEWAFFAVLVAAMIAIAAVGFVVVRRSSAG